MIILFSKTLSSAHFHYQSLFAKCLFFAYSVIVWLVMNIKTNSKILLDCSCAVFFIPTIIFDDFRTSLVTILPVRSWHLRTTVKLVKICQIFSSFWCWPPLPLISAVHIWNQFQMPKIDIYQVVSIWLMFRCTWEEKVW